MSMDTLRIGVISDTHGFLRPHAVKALHGVDLIIHAGDVGRPDILDTLRAVAPLHAVRGNIDQGPWALALPLTADVGAGEIRIYVLHDLATLDLVPATAGYRVVISGHTHQPLIEMRHDVLYLNPGSAGPKRFGLPVTLAMLYVTGRDVRAELLDLVATARGSV